MPATDISIILDDFERCVNGIESPVSTFFWVEDFATYNATPSHQHERGELLFCSKGLMNCQVGRCLWVIPENAALWIPAGTKHRGLGCTYAEFYAVYIDRENSMLLPDEPFVIHSSLLLRELIVKSASFSKSYEKEGIESRLFKVMLDEIACAERRELIVPMPANPRLQWMFEHLISNPADKTSQSEWAARLALSTRSFSRIVMQELGMTFGRWRHQMHISIAIPKIRNGESIQKVAHELGYETSSSFINMFKNIMKFPPSYFGAKTRYRKPP